MISVIISAHRHGLIDGTGDPAYQTQLAFRIPGEPLFYRSLIEVLSGKSHNTPRAGTTENE